MSPRPRTVQDDAILEAAINVLSRTGPERMTLADVGAEVGLSAATLVQRFGSKRALMLALLKHVTDGIDARFASAMASHSSPLEALFAASVDRSGPLAAPVSLANVLAFYLLGLDDPEFHALATENSRRAVRGYRKVLDDAIAAGELNAGFVDTARLAEVTYAMTMGSLLTWSVSRSGTLAGQVRRDLDILLRPFRRGPRKASGNRDNGERRPADMPQRESARNVEKVAAPVAPAA
jgi:AcrR family transcriptional regulator